MGVKESVDGIQSKSRNVFSALVTPPEVTLTKYESEQRAENLEDAETLLLASAESGKGFCK
jgi:hypothetical protein